MSSPSENPFLSGTPIPQSYTAPMASAFLRRVFALMAIALGISAATALIIPAIAPVDSEMFLLLYGSPLRWVIMLAPLGFVLALSFGIHRMSTVVATAVFLTYSAVVGLSFSFIMYIYTPASLLHTFIVAGGLFAGLALFGATTKMDLTRIGNILLIALIVLIISSLVNMFLGSSLLEIGISAAGVLIFAGLTAFDVQKILRYGAAAEAGEAKSKMAIMGALNLYLDFINLFLFLLRLLGGRK